MKVLEDSWKATEMILAINDLDGEEQRAVERLPIY